MKKIKSNELIALRMPTIAEMRNPKLAKFGAIRMSRPERRRQIKLERKVYNKCASSGFKSSKGFGMIHEKAYVPMNCAMCGELMKDIHDTHNPYPILDLCYAPDADKDNPNRCCSVCDIKVSRARLDLSCAKLIGLFSPEISKEKENELMKEAA